MPRLRPGRRNVLGSDQHQVTGQRYPQQERDQQRYDQGAAVSQLWRAWDSHGWAGLRNATRKDCVLSVVALLKTTGREHFHDTDTTRA